MGEQVFCVYDSRKKIGLATLNYVSAVEKGEALEWQQSIDKPSPTMSSFLLNVRRSIRMRSIRANRGGTK